MRAGGSCAARTILLASGSRGDVAAAGAALRLDWTDVWLYALEDAEAALVARVGLDDTNAAVCVLPADLKRPLDAHLLTPACRPETQRNATIS